MSNSPGLLDTTLFAHCSSRRAGLRLKIFYFVWCGSLIPLTKVIVHVQWEFHGTLNFTSELVICSVINFLVQYFRSLKCYDKKCIFLYWIFHRFCWLCTLFGSWFNHHIIPGLWNPCVTFLSIKTAKLFVHSWGKFLNLCKHLKPVY